MKKVLSDYVRSAGGGDPEAVFAHPGTREAYRTNPALSRKELARLAQPARMVAVYEAGAAADGTRGVLFADGHAERIRQEEWARLKQSSGIP